MSQHTLIILGSVPFKNFLWQRPQQLAVQFAKKGCNVIYVSNSRFHLRTEEPLQESLTHLSHHFENHFQHTKQDEGLTVVERVEHITGSDGLTRDVSVQFIIDVIATYQTENTTVLTYLPHFYEALAHSKERFPTIRFFYDCVDEMAGLEGTKKITYLENKLLEMVEGVIVTSKTLYVHKTLKNKRCILAPNAVSYEEFIDDVEKPSDLSALKGPIIGYVGAIAEWFDQKLICELADQNPHWQIVLIGMIIGVNVDELEKRKNIHLFGKREYDQVPGYMKHFDVGIIPFKMNDLIVNTNPIKYFEYLAAGIQTVATPMPELVNEPYCHLGSSASDFSNFISNILQNPSMEDCSAYLQANSWSKRAEDMIRFIENPHIHSASYEKTLQTFADDYKAHVTNPLITVLTAEILHDLGEKQTSISLLDNQKETVEHVCTSIQLRLAFERGDNEKIAHLLSHSTENKARFDVNIWRFKGSEFLAMHTLRKLGEFERALEAASHLSKKDSLVFEEIGCIFYELHNFGEALKYLLLAYKEKQQLQSLEANYYLCKLFKATGKQNLYQHFLTKYQQEFSQILTDFELKHL